uniref:ATP synthase F0 subunit 8 n=1 Tax=Takobia yixiani TaxID=743459 RepID=X1W3D0_9INSE|nr:ATP synthase F0 subunit 8 [Takobia yixiani]
MPQMAPMYWLILFIYFVGLFMFYVVMVYYFFLPVKSGTESGVSDEVRSGFMWLW